MTNPWRESNPRGFSRTWFALSLALVMGAGCATKIDHGVALHPAHGQVTVAGKPEAGVQVRLHPVGKLDDMDAPRPFAEAATDGQFTLGTFEAGDGAPAGDYLVTIFWPGKVQGPNGAPDQLAGKFTNITKPPYRVTIRAGDNQLEPFQIDPVGPAPSGSKTNGSNVPGS